MAQSFYRFKKILLIDDNIIDCTMNEYILSQCKFSNQIVVKYSADDGLKYLIERADLPNELPQVIFLDLSMPGKDGFDFLNQFWKLDILLGRISIIVLSASVDPIDYQRAISHPLVDNFLKKPLNIEELMQVKVGTGL